MSNFSAPDETLDRLIGEFELTMDEAKALVSLKDSPAYNLAALGVSKLMLASGMQALEPDESPQYWRGVSDGIKAFFVLVGGEANKLSDIIEAQAERERFAERGMLTQEELDEYDDSGVDPSQAFSDLGSSPL